MSHHTKLDEKLEGADNFWAGKYRISLVLEENELDSYINEEIPVPKGDEANALHKKKLVMAKRIIVDSIKDHLIPKVSSLKTPKAMFDALTKLFEGKNINQKMTLRNQLKNVKIHNVTTTFRSKIRWKNPMARGFIFLNLPKITKIIFFF